jgi:isopropylmalate/homocitrate/citramalate synthase
MARDKRTSSNNASQSERFKETARELGVELDEDKLKEALRRMGKQSEKMEKSEKDSG